MGTRTLIAQQPPAGAGRSVHIIYPDFTAVSGNPGGNAAGRVGTSQGVAVMSNVTQGAPPATTNQNYKGRWCWGLSSAAGGAGTSLQFNYRLNPQRDATQYQPTVDDCGVAEVRWLLAFDRPGADLADALDLGVGLTPGNNNQNIFNPAVGAVFRAGVQFGPGGPGKLRLRSRAAQSGVGPPPYAADFDTLNTAVAGYDEREWHWYALRLVGGSQNGAGVCKALIDGQLFRSFSMNVAAALFPAMNAGVAAVIGLLGGVTNNSNATFDKMYLARGALVLAPDEASL